jgi:hypothetical protein
VGREAAINDGGGGEAAVLLARGGRQPPDPAAGAAGVGGGGRRQEREGGRARERAEASVTFHFLPKRWVRAPRYCCHCCYGVATRFAAGEGQGSNNGRFDMIIASSLDPQQRLCTMHTHKQKISQGLTSFVLTLICKLIRVRIEK